MVDPAFGPLPVADAPPVLGFGGNLDRQPGAGIDPGDLVIAGRAAAHVDLVGLEADEAGNRQAAFGTGLLAPRLRGGGGEHRGGESQRNAGPPRGASSINVG